MAHRKTNQRAQQRKASRPFILLRSAEFGEERFDYDSLTDAQAGLERLIRDCVKSTKSDGISRDLLLCVAEFST